MITRLSGTLERVVHQDHAQCAVVSPAGGFVALEVLLPAFLAVQLAPLEGTRVTFVTLCYLEGQGQGTSFIPRLVGFRSEVERDFFELFTTVNGIGNRKALRALTLPPGVIARAIHEHDARTLSTLPEIGKRMAERIIAELDGKVEAFMTAEGARDGAGGAGVGDRVVESKFARASGSPAEQDAVAALMALGQQRAEAEEKVRRAVSKAKSAGREMGSADEIVGAVYGG